MIRRARSHQGKVGGCDVRRLACHAIPNTRQSAAFGATNSNAAHTYIIGRAVLNRNVQNKNAVLVSASYGLDQWHLLLGPSLAALGETHPSHCRCGNARKCSRSRTNCGPHPTFMKNVHALPRSTRQRKPNHSNAFNQMTAA